MSADGDIVLRSGRDFPFGPLLPPQPAITRLQLRHSIRWPVRAGIAIMLVLGLTIGVWGFAVPIAGGAVATGTVVGLVMWVVTGVTLQRSTGRVRHDLTL